MEIDFSETNLNLRGIFFAAAVLAGLFFLGSLGRFVTPDRLLTWDEWQLLQQRAAFRREVTILQGEADRLTHMVNHDEIEPIHAQLVSEDLARTLKAVTLSPLAQPRQALLDSSQAILAWSLGEAKDDTIATQERANQLILQVSQ